MVTVFSLIGVGKRSAIFMRPGRVRGSLRFPWLPGWGDGEGALPGPSPYSKLFFWPVFSKCFCHLLVCSAAIFRSASDRLEYLFDARKERRTYAWLLLLDLVWAALSVPQLLLLGFEHLSQLFCRCGTHRGVPAYWCQLRRRPCYPASCARVCS